MKAEEFEQITHDPEIANLGGDFQGKMLTKTTMEEQLKMIFFLREAVEFGGALHEKMQIKITMDMSLGGACQGKTLTETVVILHQEMIDPGQEMTARVIIMTLLLNKEKRCHQEIDDILSPLDQVLHINQCQSLAAFRWRRNLQGQQIFRHLCNQNQRRN